jgi:hypothetical protein
LPYIPSIDRPKLDRAPVKDVAPKNVGELTYVFYKLALNYFRRNGGRFQQIAEVRAALVSALSEFDRRVASPYEDEAIERNGDV